MPVRVEYALTGLGSELIKPLYGLISWADEHHEVIKKAREDYDVIQAS